MRLTGTNGTSALLHRFEKQVLSCVETLEGITEFVSYVRTTFFLDLLHLRFVVEEGIHGVEIERPRIDMRVDGMACCGTIEESFALLPMFAHSAPSRSGFRHEGRVILFCLYLSEDLLTFVEEHQSFVRHVAVGSNHGVVDIGRHRTLKRLFFVRFDIGLLVVACRHSDEACGT